MYHRLPLGSRVCSKHSCRLHEAFPKAPRKALLVKLSEAMTIGADQSNRELPKRMPVGHLLACTCR